DHGGQAEHDGRGATDDSVAGAGTTPGDAQIQPAVHYGNQTRQKAHASTHLDMIGAVRDGGSAQSLPTGHYADERQQGDDGGPKSPGSQTANRGGGWPGKVRSHQHGVHERAEQGGCGDGLENKREGSFHGFSPILLD